MRFFRESRVEQTVDFSQYFQNKFSMDDYGGEIRQRFIRAWKRSHEQELDDQTRERLRSKLTEVLQWLAETFADAFTRSSKHFNRRVDKMPAVLLETLDQASSGMYDFELKTISIRINAVLSYLLELLDPNIDPRILLASRLSLEQAIYEEVFHFVQLLDPKVLEQVESDYEKLKDLPEEEYAVIHPQLAYEREASAFVKGVQKEKLKALITPGSSQYNPRLTPKELTYIKVLMES